MTLGKKNTTYKYDRVAFQNWLIINCDYSKKVAKDYASRCSRIENHITPNIYDAVSSGNKFDQLLIDIQKYAALNADNKQAAYSLTGCLRAAVKKYALYKFPKQAKNYSTAYGKSRYE